MDNFDVIKLKDGNFLIFVRIKVGHQKRVNLVNPSGLSSPSMKAVQIILEAIPWGFGQERAENLKDKKMNQNEKLHIQKMEQNTLALQGSQ